MIRARILRLLAPLAVLVLVLTACVPALPTSGPVEAADAPQAAPYEYTITPESPQTGATQEQIVRGFLRAGAGPQDDYAVAREYLTAEAALDWSPGQRAIVYSTEPSYEPSEENVYTVELEVDSVVDSYGSMSRPDDLQRWTFELEQVDGEWRIASLPEGKFLDRGTFETVFTDITLYFYDPQQRYAVPDQRWFVTRPGLPAEIASSILAGPAPWLEAAVVSAFPAGAELGRPTVPTDDQTASVDLDSSAVAGASPGDLLLMQQQLHMALDQLPEVRTIELTAGQEELELPDASGLPEEDLPRVITNAANALSPSAENIQVGVLEGELALQRGNNTQEIEQMPDISGLGPQQPAMSHQTGEEVFAFLDESGDALYHVRPGQNSPELVVDAEDLTRPSMDNFGWTWTVSHENGEPTVHVVPHDDSAQADAAQISADLFEGRKVTSLRIAQDGTRAALVVEDAGERTLYIASVVRDASGTPRQLGQAIPLQADVEVEEVRWRANNAVVVWSPYNPLQHEGEQANRYVQHIQLDGETQTYQSLLGLENVSVGEGQRDIFAENEQTPFHALLGNGWQPNYDVEIRDLSYPG